MSFLKNIRNVCGRGIILSLPIVCLFFIVLKYGVDTIFWDDFEPITDFINMKTSGKIDWHALVALHNEHRFFFPRVIMFIIGAFSHWSTKAMMLFSAFLLSLIYLIIVFQTLQKPFKEFNFFDCGYALIVGLCLFNVVQYENLLWGFQLAWFLIEFCVVLGLYTLFLYISKRQMKYLFWSLGIGFVSSFSSLHGLAIWPCYLVVIAIYQFTYKDLDKKVWGYVLVAMICAFLLYFNGYHEVERHENGKALSIIQALKFAFANLGSVLAAGEADILSQVVGFLETILSIVLVCILIATKKVKQNILPIGLIVFSSGVALMLGFGRSGWVLMASRYTTFPLLMIVGNFALLRPNITSKNSKGWAAAVCFFILTQLNLYTNGVLFEKLAWLYLYKQQARDVLLTYKQEQPFENFYYAYPFKTLEEAIPRIEKIEKAKLSVFYDKGEK